MSESSEVVGGGTLASAAAAPPPNTSAVSAPVKEGGRGTVPEDTPLARVKPTLK